MEADDTHQIIADQVLLAKLGRLQPRIFRLAAALGELRVTSVRSKTNGHGDKSSTVRIPHHLARRMRNLARSLREAAPEGPAQELLSNTAQRVADACDQSPRKAVKTLQEVRSTLRQLGVKQENVELTSSKIITAALGKKPFEHLQRFVDNPGHWNYRTWATFLDWCEEIRMDHPPRAVESAIAGVRLGDRILQAKDHRKERRFDALRVRAWGILASSYRVQNRYSESEGALCVAMSSRIHDATVYADLCTRMMYLRMDQQRYPEADFFITAAMRIYHQGADSHRMGCALMDRGVLRGNSGKMALAVKDFRNALTKIDARRSPRYFHAAIHNLTVALATDERTDKDELLRCFKRAARLNRFPKTSLSGVKLLWLKGKVLLRTGETAAAEEALGTAAFRISQLNAPYEAALISLDLVDIYTRQGRYNEAREVAAEALRVFRAGPADLEATAALTGVCDSARDQDLTQAMISSTRDKLAGQAHEVRTLISDSH